MLKLIAPAKINLFLRITQRRADGYHEIETLFQRIGLNDELEFEPATTFNGPPVQLRIEGAGLENDHHDDNLIVKAWRALNEASGGKLRPVNVTLRKHIPVGGGMGGGSSDAATALRAYEQLFQPGVDETTLQKLATGLGADVPFFLNASAAALGRGIGEQLVAAPHAAPFWVVLAFPPYGVSTRDVYRRWNPDAPDGASDLPGLLDALKTNDLPGTLSHLYNNMETPAFAIRPELGELRMRLEKIAGQPVRMSGSGSTLFTLTRNESSARQIQDRWLHAEEIATAAAPFVG